MPAAVKLQSWAIKASGCKGQAPRRCKLFVNRPSLGFSEAADFPAVQEFTLTEADLEGKPLLLKCAPSCCSSAGLVLALHVPDQAPHAWPAAAAHMCTLLLEAERRAPVCWW